MTISASTSIVPLPNLQVLPQTASTTSTSQTPGTLPSVDPALLKTVTESQQKANAQIETALNKLDVRLAKFDAERSEAIKTLKEPKPVLPQWTTEQKTEYNNSKTGLMSTWRNGAQDAGGENANEARQLTEMDGLLTNGAAYLTYPEAMAMLGAANKDGRMQNDRKTWENGKGAEAIGAMRGYVDVAEQTFKQDVAAWQQRQNVANTILGNATRGIDSTQKWATSTLAMVKSMSLGEVASLYQNMASWTPQTAKRSNEEEEQRRPALTQSAQVRVSVSTSPLQPLAQGPLTVNVNVSLA